MATPERQEPGIRNGDGERMAPAVSSQDHREERPHEGARAMRSLVGHFADLTREVSALVRDETALARAEISEDISQIKQGAGSLAVAGSLAFAGLLFLLGAAFWALALIWPLWLASLVVGVGALILGAIAAVIARQLTKPANLTLDRTMESGRSIGRTAKEAMR